MLYIEDRVKKNLSARGLMPEMVPRSKKRRRNRKLSIPMSIHIRREFTYEYEKAISEIPSFFRTNNELTFERMNRLIPHWIALLEELNYYVYKKYAKREKKSNLSSSPDSSAITDTSAPSANFKNTYISHSSGESYLSFIVDKDDLPFLQKLSEECSNVDRSTEILSRQQLDKIASIVHNLLRFLQKSRHSSDFVIFIALITGTFRSINLDDFVHCTRIVKRKPKVNKLKKRRLNSKDQSKVTVKKSSSSTKPTSPPSIDGQFKVPYKLCK